jgi:predicted TIM-barrel fold metal-dependent hydrolase
MAVSNPHAYSFGHPIFDPIHRACADTGLPFAIHTFGEAMGCAVPSATAGGYPSLYAEFHSSSSQALMTHLTSFVVHGVFDRYPDFKLVLVEGGSTWLPAYLRRFEADFKGIRREFPWCKKLPTEYVHDHVRISTQPLDVESSDDRLMEALGEIGAEDVLIFASDYPHWDTDVPTKTQSVLPTAWRQKVGFENAAKLYNISLPCAA